MILWKRGGLSAMNQMPDSTSDIAADREHALAMFDVSRETAARLDLFLGLLLALQSPTNLISSLTISSLWTRHIADSLQLLQLVPISPCGNPPVWLDLGSGGGFPGIVVACSLADVP